jgi:hypothetical protein
MNTVLKYAGAATLTAALALAAAMPGNARDWQGGGAAAAGFAAGAVVGAAAASNAYNGGYYYGGDYAYDSGLAYDPGPAYAYDGPYYGRSYQAYRSRSWNHGNGPGCDQSPASQDYTSCD